MLADGGGRGKMVGGQDGAAPRTAASGSARREARRERARGQDRQRRGAAERGQVLIARDQEVRPGGERQVREHRVVAIAAGNRRGRERARQADDLAEREIVLQQRFALRPPS